jgi:hypothetical protein
VAAYRYNESRARTLQNAFRQRPLLRMQDKNLEQLAIIGGERSVRFEEIATDTGEAGVVIRGGSDLGDFVRNAVRSKKTCTCRSTSTRSRPSWKTRWGGKITTINVKRDSDGIHTVELIASAQREHLKHVFVGVHRSSARGAAVIHVDAAGELPNSLRDNTVHQLDAPVRAGFVDGDEHHEPVRLAQPVRGWAMQLQPAAVAHPGAVRQRRAGSVPHHGVHGGVERLPHRILDMMRDAGVCARAYTVFTDDVDHPQPELAALLPNTPLNSIPIVGSLLTAVEAYLLENNGVDEHPRRR